ncbi:hypothetical protein ES703_30642 [subsurface metagenome]
MESVQKSALSASPNQVITENSKYMNLKDALSAVHVKEIALQWLFSYKSVKGAVVYGMLELDLKTLRVIVVADKKPVFNNTQPSDNGKFKIYEPERCTECSAYKRNCPAMAILLQEHKGCGCLWDARARSKNPQSNSCCG